MTRTPIIVIACALAANAAAADPTLAHQGRLLDALGGPVSGAHTLRLALYDDATGGTQLHTEDFSLTILDGYYAVVLGEDTGNPIAASDLAGDVWLEITLNPPAAPLGARQRLHDVPRAALALTATGGGGAGSGGGAGADWVSVPSDLTMEVNTAYMTTSAGEVVLTLPATCLSGDEIHVAGGAGSFRVETLAGQSVFNGSNGAVTVGPNTRVVGSRFGELTLRCVSSTEWHIRERVGEAGICAMPSIVPIMSKPSQDGYIVDASTSSPAGGYDGWNAMDGTIQGDGTWNWLVYSVGSAWLRVQLPSPHLVTAYSIAHAQTYNRLAVPKAWTFEGSNNGSTWTVLDTRDTNPTTTWQASPPDWAGGENASLFLFENTDTYTYYRLNISQKADPSYPHIGVGSLKMFDCQ